MLKTFIFTLFFLTVFFLSVWGYLTEQDKKLTNKIYPNVYINGVNFGGKFKKDVESHFHNKNRQLEAIQFTVFYKRDDVATFSGKMIQLGFDTKTPAIQALEIGRSPFFLSRHYTRLVSLFNLGEFHLTSPLKYDLTPLREHLDYLADKYNKEPENALFKYENGRVTAFKIEKNGLEIKKDDALDFFERLVLQSPHLSKIPPVEIGEKIIKPAITLSVINNFGIVEKIGEGRSDYTGSIPGRVHNVLLASSKFDGVLIPKGATFSFNEIIGDISAATGYQPAYIIKNGQTVLGDGGGVCQVSTTLFRAALDTGLPILERTAHTYRVHYYEQDRKPGFDATVFSPSVDLKFKNDTPAHILIQREVDKQNHRLAFIMYGKQDGRTVEISEVKLYDLKPAPEPLYQDDPTLKKGIIKQVDWAAPGTKTKFHYRVVKEGKIVVDQDFFSNYRAWRAVYLIGTAD